MGRPTKLTPDVQERIVQALRAGNYADAAVRSAGIATSTFYRWLERGEDETTGIYREFRDAVRLAEAEAEVHAVAVIRRAMPDDWRAAMTYLERRHPDRWRRRQTTEVTGVDGGPAGTGAPQIDLTTLSEEDLKALEEIYARAGKSE